MVIIIIYILMNKSIVEGVVSDELKIAQVIRVYKSKAKDGFPNYKSVSLLPSVSKKYWEMLYIEEPILCKYIT